jgi:transcriptional regulator with XRE-family HTH domain
MKENGQEIIKEEDLKKLAKRIRELRQEKGYTNYENFAYVSDLPRAQYGRYEKGEDLRYSSLMKVIRALGISVKDFFSEGFDE